MADAYRWGMVVDVDRCSGCQACVVACQAENNIPINEEQRFIERRAKEWIRVERYWEGEFPDVKARFLPVLCQHCGNAPCEPVCPVNAIQHNSEGLNVQVYNRCVGTRYCGNNCPYNVRFFNFWEPEWPEPLNSQLNPDVTVRSKGVMEKCTFCVQRINRVKRDASAAGRTVRDGELQPACAQACPTSALVFGNWNDPSSRINALLARSGRDYRLLGHLGTEPSVVYLKAVDAPPPAPASSESASSLVAASVTAPESPAASVPATESAAASVPATDSAAASATTTGLSRSELPLTEDDFERRPRASAASGRPSPRTRASVEQEGEWLSGA